ncbi:MAG: hypothetical protein AAFY11_09270, partial [Cyanobacteria bacterium J06641_5]
MDKKDGSNFLSLRLGILAPGDPDNVRTYSGIPFFMTQALKKRLQNISYLPEGYLKERKTIGRKINQLSRRLFRKGYVPGHVPYALSKKAKEIDLYIEKE